MIIMGGTVHGTTGFLMYDNIDAAHEYIVRVFGLTAGPIWKSDDGVTEFAEVRAGAQVIGLHPAGGPSYRSPRSVDAVTGTTAISVDDVDAHYASTVSRRRDHRLRTPRPAIRNPRIRRERPEGQIWWFTCPLG